MKTGLLLVGHGSRDPNTRLEHDALEARVREAFPDWNVTSGFIELSEPPLSEALRQLAPRCDRVVVVPLLLFSGGHMQRDIPAAISQAQQYAPQTLFVVSEPFGLSPQAIALASASLGRVLPQSSTDPALTCLLVGRGALEVEAQRAFQEVARQLAVAHPAVVFALAYCGVQEPNVATALEQLVAAGKRRIVVLPYLLFTGRLLRDVGQAIQSVVVQHTSAQITLADHLGPDAALAAISQATRALEASFSPKS